MTRKTHIAERAQPLFLSRARKILCLSRTVLVCKPQLVGSSTSVPA